jgi:hypothetical protein
MVLDKANLIKTNSSLMRLFIKSFSQRFIFHQPVFEQEILINFCFLSISSTSFFRSPTHFSGSILQRNSFASWPTGGGGTEGHGSVSEGEKEGEIGKSIIEADW